VAFAFKPGFNHPDRGRDIHSDDLSHPDESSRAHERTPISADTVHRFGAVLTDVPGGLTGLEVDGMFLSRLNQPWVHHQRTEPASSADFVHRGQ